MSNETVRELCEMATSQSWLSYWHADGKTIKDFVDMILAAYEREMAAVVVERDAEILRRATLERDIAAKDAEIAKHERCYHALELHCKKLEEEYLRATNALKPMMEVHLNDGGTTPLSDSICAVAEAQRIVEAWDDKNYFDEDAHNRVAKAVRESEANHANA